ncbi:S8 family serine peptidase [Siphonobacter sp. SORGH_AS_0500]|uniref:S8 family serine peptidase n=1 Tax=Siphonobacter sp. SORGH_AS_0500 TaxID=1864824 RepID=UPI002866B109|nr:S8 family serine peptidase [Siphonobacter sp. SORGH_AS_0500]MDR6196483.1 serine protease AprX [Siphonobacter sp. SORGH_AS_0500]
MVKNSFRRFRASLTAFVLLAGACLSAEAQTTAKYLILFKDKTNSPYDVNRPQEFLSKRSIERRFRQNIVVSQQDLPPNPAYIQAVREKGAKVWYKSRWANGVLVECTPQQLDDIKTLTFVTGNDGNVPLSAVPVGTSSKSGSKAFHEIKPLDLPPLSPKAEPLNYGYSQTQIGQMRVDSMHARGFHGEGMQVAVIDNGFLSVNTQAAFKHLFDENRIIGTYDFVANNTNVYDQGTHGNNVLSLMAAYLPGQLIGTAYKASYLLLHTEDNSGEKRQEEAFWLAAAEYADSVGVDVINSSLGYSTFDNAATNYTYEDLNGKKALSSRAAKWAAQRGILVVVAAGNEGNDAWRYITVPADADSIISVGAVDSHMARASFSSVGPTSDGRIKPDLSALGAGNVINNALNGQLASGSGTSFASPLLAGMATSFWQAYPYLTNMEVISMLKRSASQNENPDSFLGFGVPNYLKAAQAVQTYRQGPGVRILPNPSTGSNNPIVELPFNEQNNTYVVTLLDAAGRIFWEGQASGRRAELAIGSLPVPSGLYLLRFTRESENYTARWMKW